MTSVIVMRCVHHPDIAVLSIYRYCPVCGRRLDYTELNTGEDNKNSSQLPLFSSEDGSELEDKPSRGIDLDPLFQECDHDWRGVEGRPELWCLKCGALK